MRSLILAALCLGISADEAFKVKFDVQLDDNTEGAFVVEVHPEWAPLGAARFKEIIEQKVWDEARFFRVLPGFVVQWGIPGDAEVAKEWQAKKIQDDPRVESVSNKKGYMSFAKSGPNTRTTQVFINYGDNANLDGMGFPPFGRVVSGMDIVTSINSKSGQSPNQGQIQQRGNEYLKEAFPHLSYIKTAYFVNDEEL
eukprot:TRINITY_DN1456_c0_g1_i1.p2 TRINITY_DN1456_c0_g1~~TRINITY_DN1456_c0_g1_i1.p2  ORF type:complete len:197 (+),score=83.62 TRINITY_DN1456_c0_g1_i1:44-634(+)